MIAIVSSNARERMAFGAMCDTQGWAAVECESLRAFKRTLQQLNPTVVLTRNKLSDGYADDVTKIMVRDSARTPARVVVLFDAGASPAIEARQIALGATCVLRDPIRTEVLLAYLTKYVAEPFRQGHNGGNRALRDAEFDFAGARVHPMERKIETARRATHVTPRELELIRLLDEATGEVVTYQSLYSEMLGRRFRGDTSNMRVLLGKLDRSFGALQISLRKYVEVIPKTGYRYVEKPGNG
ncbi:MAG: winged helix-turn-helix domain-containing protein [Opitutaceae bacterium]|nr:winged helix-turn-helix domain-containing protein [Opitutaceae bacterium]